VIAPDLRGAGWTDAPASGYTADHVLADVLALLDALDLRRVGLVAHDFSAFVGFRLCFDHADRVAGFLCLGPHPYLRFRPYMLAGIPALWFQPVVATPGLGPWALGTDRLPRHLLAGFAGTPDSFSAEDLAVFSGRLHADGHPEAGSALYRHLILPEMSRFMTAGGYRARRLSVPTVSLVGGADAGVREGMLDVHGDRADDLVGHVIEGAGHFIADDRPDAVVAHALELFGRVLRAAEPGRE
jgi:pimeloyl-ACP methyl ester carboxylesterase